MRESLARGEPLYRTTRDVFSPGKKQLVDNKLDTMFRGGKVDNYFKASTTMHMAHSLIVWLPMLGVPCLLRRKRRRFAVEHTYQYHG